MAVLIAAPTFAQFRSGGFYIDQNNIYYGIRFGVTSASLSGDIKSDASVGMTLAGIVGLRVSNTAPVFLESGFYYTERGGKLSGVTLVNPAGVNKGDVTLSYNNFEIPVVIKYGIVTNENIVILPFMGPTFGYAVKCADELNRANMGFKLGCGVEYNQLYLEAGYHLGITDAVDGALTGHSNAWFLNFGINF